jgi:hypothetical protein
VFIEYGRGATKSSWEHLFSHGFVPEARGTADALKDALEDGTADAVAHWQSAGGRPMQVQVLRADDPLLEQKKAMLISLGADDDVESGVEVEPRPGYTYCGATYCGDTYYGATLLRSTCGPARLRRGPRCCALAR